ncbi:hypothetical protein OXX80_010887 [Metschnikowia pulcherrima]
MKRPVPATKQDVNDPMGFKKIFKKKEPSEGELVEDLQRLGVSTKTSSGRQEKFGAFKQYAHERQTQRPGLIPVNPYADVSGAMRNPYAESALTEKAEAGRSSSEGINGFSNADGGTQVESKTTSLRSEHNGFNPYASKEHRSSNAESKNRQGSKRSDSFNPYENARTQPSVKSTTNRWAENISRDSGGRDFSVAKVSSSSGSKREVADVESILDLNDIPSARPPVQARQPMRRQFSENVASVDLNELPDEDLNLDLDEILSEQEQVNSEDEEVEIIKQDIRFTKQESVASTRNTLRMAQEAEASGTNTLGMLGSQSERLYNAEQNLLLADTQTKIADEKVRELGRLNRSIFIPATGNPFNKKSRLRQQEQKLKADKMQEKYLRDTNRKGMYASEQRLAQGITSKAPPSELYNKYQGEKQIQQAQRYQFENDSEDDEMEKELASNLDQISSYSKKLKNTAKVMGVEVDAQNDRLRRIEEDADRLDINVHLNSSRLNNIR